MTNRDIAAGIGHCPAWTVPVAPARSGRHHAVGRPSRGALGEIADRPRLPRPCGLDRRARPRRPARGTLGARHGERHRALVGPGLRNDDEGVGGDVARLPLPPASWASDPLDSRRGGVRRAGHLHPARRGIPCRLPVDRGGMSAIPGPHVRDARWVLGIGGLVLLAAPVSYLIQNAGSIDVGQELRDVAQPLWLTLGCLPVCSTT